MWLITKEAFVSVVCTSVKDQPPFVVRCRCKQQLTDFLRAYSHQDLIASILETKDSDYRYRVYFTPKELQSTMAAVASKIDYRNFKDACVGNKTYKHFLLRLWNLGADTFGAYGSRGKS